ncbi:MAG: hypothetical protein ACOX1I_09495 [Dethiobacteria bacterium]|jgi:hypothetical protein|nr:hypothetical protein [Bacillota bacterium]
MQQTVLFILFVIFILGIGILLSRLLMVRAIKEIIRIFFNSGALDAQNAKTREELGIVPQSFLERMYRIRDYKPYALQTMLNAGIIRETSDARYYLSEEKLSATALNKYR